MKGFGTVFDFKKGAVRSYYLDENGQKRFADNDELVENDEKNDD